jgi:serine/threonine-protein phosphatase 2A regulatory subunit B'
MNQRSKFLHWLYSNCIPLRPLLRQQLGNLLTFKGSVKGNLEGGDRYRHVEDLLKLLSSIIDGFQTPLTNEDLDIMRDILLPLHTPNEMVEWRDQIPIIQSYHGILVQTCVKLIHKDRSSRLSSMIESSSSRLTLFVDCMIGVLNSWPSPKEANTSKEVLLLHECETLLQHATEEEYKEIESQWIERWSNCIYLESINVRTKQRALQVFKNESVTNLGIKASSSITSSDSDNRFLSIMIPSLYRGGELSWNPTANKMVALALRKLEVCRVEASAIFFVHN